MAEDDTLVIMKNWDVGVQAYRTLIRIESLFVARELVECVALAIARPGVRGTVFQSVNIGNESGFVALQGE